MGGKGSGRPKGSTKPLWKRVVGLQEDMDELVEQIELVSWTAGVLGGKLETLRRKVKLEEYRQTFRELEKK